MLNVLMIARSAYDDPAIEKAIQCLKLEDPFAYLLNH